jgi:hypothetical protein
MSTLNSDGIALISAYLNTQQTVASCEHHLQRARDDHETAEKNLATWLKPEDMKSDEKIGVWMGDSLFQIEMIPKVFTPADGSAPVMRYVPKITVRYRGKEFYRLTERK